MKPVYYFYIFCDLALFASKHQEAVVAILEIEVVKWIETIFLVVLIF